MNKAMQILFYSTDDVNYHVWGHLNSNIFSSMSYLILCHNKTVFLCLSFHVEPKCAFQNLINMKILCLQEIKDYLTFSLQSEKATACENF